MSLALKRHKGAVQPPRFVWDYDTVGRINFHRDSEDLENWASKNGVLTNLTVSNDQYTATLSDGQQVSMALLTGDATVAVHSVLQYNHFGDGTPDPSLLVKWRKNSVYVKKGTCRYVVVSDRVILNGGGTQYQSIFDFDTESWVYTGTFYGNHGFEDVGGGVYRLWFNNGVNSTAYNESAIGLANGTTVSNLAFDATGKTIYAGGWQIDIINSDDTNPPAPYGRTLNGENDAGYRAQDARALRDRGRSTTAWTAPTKDNPNWIEWSEDFDLTNWASLNMDAPVDSGVACTINGKRIKTKTTGESNAAAFAYIQPSGLTYNGEVVHLSVYVKKDSIPSTTRYPMIRLSFIGGTSQAYDFGFATDDADYAANGNFHASGKDLVVDDNGVEWWHVWFCADDNGNGNTQVYPQLYPAVGANTSLTSYNSAATGSIVIGGWQLGFGEVTEAPEYFGPTGQTTATVPDYFYDNGVTPNVIYLYKGAVQPTKLDLTRDFSVGSDEWFAWRRRRRDQVRAAQWSNPKGPIY